MQVLTKYSVIINYRWKYLLKELPKLHLESSILHTSANWKVTNGSLLAPKSSLRQMWRKKLWLSPMAVTTKLLNLTLTPKCHKMWLMATPLPQLVHIVMEQEFEPKLSATRKDRLSKPPLQLQPKLVDQLWLPLNKSVWLNKIYSTSYLHCWFWRIYNIDIFVLLYSRLKVVL